MRVGLRGEVLAWTIRYRTIYMEVGKMRECMYYSEKRRSSRTESKETVT